MLCLDVYFYFFSIKIHVPIWIHWIVCNDAANASMCVPYQNSEHKRHYSFWFFCSTFFCVVIEFLFVWPLLFVIIVVFLFVDHCMLLTNHRSHRISWMCQMEKCFTVVGKTVRMFHSIVSSRAKIVALLLQFHLFMVRSKNSRSFIFHKEHTISKKSFFLLKDRRNHNKITKAKQPSQLKLVCALLSKNFRRTPI